MSKYFQEFCNTVVALDPSIRFTGIADQDGKLEATSERKGLKPLLNADARAEYAVTAATRQATRLRWEYLLGRIKYATSHYDKLIRATIPIADQNRRLSHVLILSFEPNTESVHEIITKKIIPLIHKNMDRFIEGT